MKKLKKFASIVCVFQYYCFAWRDGARLSSSSSREDMVYWINGLHCVGDKTARSMAGADS